ncbi:transposase family protein [Proteiniphilum sp. X52]|uniref:transposase family protein n=1 Tax=Proteiniphilum sp. X52 TaxID=2382159 RepID=UPI001313DDC0|nr:transposase family protein [Proteiniphilum sp. X52]
MTLSKGITLWQDTGFLGHSPKDVTVKMPTKKPKGKELSDDQKKENDDQKKENREISSFRILVEHAIGGIKKCRIVKERFRCRKFGFDDLVMLIACGLHNFRITMSLNLSCI